MWEGFAEVISTGQEFDMLSGVDRVTEQFQGISGLPFAGRSGGRLILPASQTLTGGARWRENPL